MNTNSLHDTMDNLSELLGYTAPAQEATVAYAWYVGATGNNDDGVYTDFSDLYIAEGRWENRWDDKFLDDVKSMKVGDRIALKASYTKKNALPFNNNGKTVSVMSIKAIGTVTGNAGDGKHISVDWTKITPVKEWYGAGVLRSTLHFVNGSESLLKSSLLKFTFEDMPQDYSYCEEQYKDESLDTEENIQENEVIVENRAKGGINRIYYGAPGCGKSRYVSDILREADVAKENILRVTFHPEYANCDFIGQILPVVEEKRDETGKVKEVVKYIFNPGPFTLALQTAYNTSEMVYLIIEEINRGNAAAIFGDTFQLLDRVRETTEDSYSSSEYPICNPNMQAYLISKVFDNQSKARLSDGVYIPSNLTIFATMNSSDQNVFTLDTAFKRRWSFEQISNDINKDSKHSYKNWYIPGTEVTWASFLTKLNDKILDYKLQNQTNEDKRLGKYFVTKDCLVDPENIPDDVTGIAQNFAYKVLEYVWNDVCKIGREEWFDIERFKTLEALIEAFIDPKEGETPLSVFQNITF